MAIIGITQPFKLLYLLCSAGFAQMSSVWGECQGNHYRLLLPRVWCHGRSSALCSANTSCCPPSTTFSISFKPTTPHSWEMCSFSFLMSLVYLFSQQNGRWEEELPWNYFGMLYSLWNLHARHLKARAKVKLWVTDMKKMVNPGWLQYLNWTVLPFVRPRPF